jgi:hypothetical protein
VFVPPQYWLTLDAERERYAHHDNALTNRGYVHFLEAVADVVDGLALHKPRVLDFGSGEHAVLTTLFRDRGFDCTPYDPLYAATCVPTGTFDVIVVCEVIEHLRELRAEMHTLRNLLSPAGHIVVRTQLYPSQAGFLSWWYTRDATHINFFVPKTLAYAAGLVDLACRPTHEADIFVWHRY